MPPRVVTADEFANWLTPSQAIEILDTAFGTDSNSYTSKHTLLERLRGDMVRAIANRSKRSDRSRHEEATEIDPKDWEHVRESHIFWTTGDLTYTVHDGFHSASVRLFDVRFEPDAVRAIVGGMTPKKASDATRPSEGSEAKPRPPVSEADLKAWYWAYQKAYGGTQADTEPHALASAQGMFRDKTVSREAVRRLRGPQKPGPKGPRDSSQ